MGVGVLVGVVVGLAAPAGAKGATSLTVTGPGISLDAPIEVSGRTHPDEWEDILVSSGLHEALPDLGSSGLPARAEAVYLGPRHTLTWHVMTGPGETTPIRQDLYLQADGGPLIYTDPGQPIWDGVTSGGWYQPPERFRQALADACVPMLGNLEASPVCWKRQLAAKAASAQGTGRAVAEPAAGDPWWPEAAAGSGAASVVGLAAAVTVRRARLSRRRRMAPISL